jgi:hypothetical protein
MIKRLLNAVLPALMIVGLLGPTFALCLPAPQRMSCCPEPCSGHQTSAQESPCCRPALPARSEQKIFRAETAALAACPPALLSSQAPVLSVDTALIERLADAPPNASSGLSPPLLA